MGTQIRGLAAAGSSKSTLCQQDRLWHRTRGRRGNMGSEGRRDKSGNNIQCSIISIPPSLSVCILMEIDLKITFFAFECLHPAYYQKIHYTNDKSNGKNSSDALLILKMSFWGETWCGRSQLFTIWGKEARGLVNLFKKIISKTLLNSVH